MLMIAKCVHVVQLYCVCEAFMIQEYISPGKVIARCTDPTCAYFDKTYETNMPVQEVTLSTPSESVVMEKL